VKIHSCKPEEKYFQDHIILDCMFSPRPCSRCCAAVGVFAANKWF